MELLQSLCEIHAPSGEEFRLKEFILEYTENTSDQWLQKPIVYHDGLQDGLMLVFGKPRTAVFAHLDSIGFTVRYHDQLVPIGGPEIENGIHLKGEDSLGPIRCQLKVNDENQLFYDFGRAIERGTTLTFDEPFSVSKEFITSPYLDNRMGVYCALKIAETLEDGILCFTTHEEHGGGSVPVFLDFIMRNHPVKQALIADITWVTEGVRHGEGVVISLRDRNIPRKLFTNKIVDLAKESGISFQLEVEGSGSSDGREIQISPYPVDWCFIGAPENNVHSPFETVHVKDLQAMVDLYNYLLRHL